MEKSPLPKMALSRCRDEREEVVRGVTGKLNLAQNAGEGTRIWQRKGNKDR